MMEMVASSAKIQAHATAYAQIGLAALAAIFSLPRTPSVAAAVRPKLGGRSRRVMARRVDSSKAVAKAEKVSKAAWAARAEIVGEETATPGAKMIIIPPCG